MAGTSTLLAVEQLGSSSRSARFTAAMRGLRHARGGCDESAAAESAVPLEASESLEAAWDAAAARSLFTCAQHGVCEDTRDRSKVTLYMRSIRCV